MKTIKRILPLLFIAVMIFGLFPLGALASGDEITSTEDPSGEITDAAPSPEEEETIPPETPPTDMTADPTEEPAATPEVPDGTDQPENTPAPGTETPIPTETDAPAPTPTAGPTSTAAPTATPTEAPEVDPPSEDEPSIGEAHGDGIVMGPNNPPEDAPMMFAAYSSSATIAVRSCYDSSGNSIKYAYSFKYNDRWVGGATYPRHIIYANNTPAYCIDPGAYLPGGSNVTTSAATIWAGYSAAKKDAIKLAILCGAEGNAANLSGSYGSQYTATQMIVWEFVVGVRSTTVPYSVSDNKVINSVCYNGANPEVNTIPGIVAWRWI